MPKLSKSQQRFFDDFERITGQEPFTKSSVEAGSTPFKDAKEKEIRMFENWAVDAIRQVTSL